MLRVLLLGALFSICAASTLQLPSVYVPPHIPFTTVTPVSYYEIPWWLGGYVADVNETANWTLPLTYPNGGKSSVGMTLIIQNQGPFNITLYPTSPETIEGLSSYLIVADSTVSILSAQDWVVVTDSGLSASGSGNFEYLQVQNASASCWLGVGTSTPGRHDCGDLTATNSLTVGSSVTTDSVIFSSKTLTTTSSQIHGIRNSVVFNSTNVGSADAWGIRNDASDVGNVGPLGNYQGLTTTLTHGGLNTVVNARGLTSSVLVQSGSGTISGNIDAFFGTIIYSSANAKTIITGYRGFRSPLTEGRP